jgi:EmrB/QacA subfamily drug resistance transporter
MGGGRNAGESWRVLTLVCSAQFMVVLDVSVVNVALPSIRTSLHAGPAAVPWMANAYALVFAGLLLLGGRLADIYGRKQTFLVGVVVFSVASLLGGLATSPAMLIVARALQGVGAAVVAPATLTIITTTYREGHRRSRALAIWTAVSSLGGAGGNLLGGVITETFSWRWILLVNVAVGAAVIPAATRHLRGGHAQGAVRPRLDIPGAAAATIAVAALAYGFTRTQSHPWTDTTIVASLTVGAAALLAFVVIEARIASTPLFPLRLLRVRSVSIGNAIVLLSGACLSIPVWYFLTFYMQDVLHYSALQTGLGFLPHTLLGAAFGIGLTPWLMSRIPHRTLVVAGAAITAVGFLWQSEITPTSSYTTGILGPAVILSFGGALFVTPITALATSGVTETDAGAASGLMNTAKQFGGVLGLAVLVGIAGASRHNPQSITSDYRRVFLVMTAALALIALLALLLPKTRDAAPATSPTRH